MPLGNLTAAVSVLRAAFAADPKREVAMWIEKIRQGVLELQTDNGLVYLRPSLAERVRLLWTFRNFQLLPQQVLKQRELTLVAGLLRRGTIPCRGECRIGTIEWPLPSGVHAVATSMQKSGPSAANTNECSLTKEENFQFASNRRHRRKRSKRTAMPHLAVTASCPARPR